MKSVTIYSLHQSHIYVDLEKRVQMGHWYVSSFTYEDLDMLNRFLSYHKPNIPIYEDYNSACKECIKRNAEHFTNLVKELGL